MRILIVEDEPLVLLALALDLASEGHDCVEALTLAEGRAAFAAEAFDGVICDVMLGSDSAEPFLLEARRSSPDVVLIVATARDPKEIIVPQDQRTAVLRKPYSPREIAAMLRRLSEVDAPASDGGDPSLP